MGTGKDSLNVVEDGSLVDYCTSAWVGDRMTCPRCHRQAPDQFSLPSIMASRPSLLFLGSVTSSLHSDRLTHRTAGFEHASLRLLYIHELSPPDPLPQSRHQPHLRLFSDKLLGGHSDCI
jgi:hypothetical protein